MANCLWQLDWLTSKIKIFGNWEYRRNIHFDQIFFFYKFFHLFKAWLSKILWFSSLSEGNLPSSKDENHSILLNQALLVSSYDLTLSPYLTQKYSLMSTTFPSPWFESLSRSSPSPTRESWTTLLLSVQIKSLMSTTLTEWSRLCRSNLPMFLNFFVSGSKRRILSLSWSKSASYPPENKMNGLTFNISIKFCSKRLFYLL